MHLTHSFSTVSAALGAGASKAYKQQHKVGSACNIAVYAAVKSLVPVLKLEKGKQQEEKIL